MIQVLIVDDHRVLSDGIKAALHQTDDIRVSGQVTDGYGALEYLAQNQQSPDVILTDLEMKGMNGLALLRHFKEKFPDLKVIVLTQHDNYYEEAFQAGAKAYLLKESGLNEIIDAIRKVAEGGTFDHPFLGTKVKIVSMPEFTTRELQIIGLIVEEFTTRQIADKLNLPFSAVETFTRNIRRKTGASNIAGIVKFALQNKLIE